MELVHVRPRRSEDDERMMEILNRIFHDRPPYTVDELRHFFALQPPEAHLEMHVAEREGMVVGGVAWWRAAYIKEQNAYYCEIDVDPSFWGRGIGSALYDLMLHAIRRRGAKRLYARFRDDLPEAERFARNRGFVPSGRTDRMSRLEVKWARLETCREAYRRVSDAGIRITTLAELAPSDEELLRAVHRLEDETLRDVPSAEEYVSMPFERWRARALEAPGFSFAAFWLALEGDRPVGTAELRLREARAAFNAYTCVDRAYRGKGIARALKLRTVEWAAQNGVDVIYTGNDLDNKPMLAINIDLGYQPLPAMVSVVKEPV